MTQLTQTLKTYFGYNEFRPYQEEVVSSILNGKDTLVVLPTGSGKSLCYQLPARLKEGTAVVISPLIALMQDQVDDLSKMGIPATCLNSSVEGYERQYITHHLKDFKLIYVAPERFDDATFIAQLQAQNISFFVIDEAHCISQWGHSFRPHYRQLSKLKRHFPGKPIAAFTATATADVRKDICTQLSLQNPHLILSSFDRPNLSIHIHDRHDGEEQLLQFLTLNPDKSGIIYANTRNSVDKLHEFLKKKGFSVTKYHAGLSDTERLKNQRAFIQDDISLMVATVAFGMGIHKPDIRFVVHMDMPKTMEQYYQEIGRAGRDGLPSECLMLFSTRDVILQKNFSDDVEDEAIRHYMRRKTDQLFAFCSSVTCRRVDLLGYFGEKTQTEHCNNCDNCIDDVEVIDGLIIAQKILSCVYRLDQRFGINYVIDVLTGSQKQQILNFKHDKLSTYNLLADMPRQELRHYIFSLINMGYLIVTEGQYPLLKLTESYKKVFRSEVAITFRKKHYKKTTSKKEKLFDAEGSYDKDLFKRLKVIRKRLADDAHIPPFMVFSDKALIDMCKRKPQTEKDFLEVNGVGPKKLAQFGDAFLLEISSPPRNLHFTV